MQRGKCAFEPPPLSQLELARKQLLLSAGQSDFKGPLFHTAQWRSDVSLKDKRVAIIGTGASAVQVVPNIAKDVKDLYVFQRTACWSPPRNDFQYYQWAKVRFLY